MEAFNIIAGICSIIGLALSIFATAKVIKLEKKVQVNGNIIQSNKMNDNNTVIGGNSNGK